MQTAKWNIGTRENHKKICIIEALHGMFGSPNGVLWSKLQILSFNIRCLYSPCYFLSQIVVLLQLSEDDKLEVVTTCLKAQKH